MYKTVVQIRCREAFAYAVDCAKRTPPGRTGVVIFAQGRTGSTLLESLLCSTGHFHANGELLNITRSGEVKSPIRFVRGLSKRGSDKNFLFHVKVHHLTDERKKPVDPASFLETLTDEGFKVIYLRRKNIILHPLSNVLLAKRGKTHKFDDGKEDLRVTIDCASFTEKVKARLRFREQEKSALRSLPYCEVVYEDDLQDSTNQQATINRILDYLALEKRKVHTKHRKVNTGSLRELITNYDDFVECITDHGWQRYLD